MTFTCRRVSIDHMFEVTEVGAQVVPRATKVQIQDSGTVSIHLEYSDPDDDGDKIAVLTLVYSQEELDLTMIRLWFANSPSPGYNPEEVFKKTWREYEIQNNPDYVYRNLEFFRSNVVRTVDLRFGGDASLSFDSDYSYTSGLWGLRAERLAEDDPHLVFERRDLEQGIGNRLDNHWPLSIEATFLDILPAEVRSFLETAKSTQGEFAGEKLDALFGLEASHKAIPEDAIPLRL